MHESNPDSRCTIDLPELPIYRATELPSYRQSHNMPFPRQWSLSDSLHERYLHLTGVPVVHDVRPYYAALETMERMGCREMSDTGLKSLMSGIRRRARDNEPLDTLLPPAFAAAREAAARVLGMRPFDVQVAAGVALHRGCLAQLATGEGKTLVAVLPALLRALTGRTVHIFTANDYLARRDAEWMGPLYRFFDIDTAFVVQGMTHDERRRAYAADVTYVTAKEAGFDYLRDHTTLDVSRLVHRGHDFAIVDEADFILIDEARVPLVIAGEAPAPDVDPQVLAAVVRRLRPAVDYTADEYGRTVVLTEAGFRHAESLIGVTSLSANPLLLSAVHVALHAETLLRRDRDYVVRDGRVEIVDEWTGRVAENRRWPHGIQPAVEAKEGVPIRPEGRILGSIPMQHFVRLYSTLAGMTATAVPAAEEFHAFFGLTTVVFPPNRDCRRVDEPDVVFTHRAAKQAALVGEVVRVHATSRPVLVGTASVRESEEVAGQLQRRGVACRVLNARQDAHEAQVISEAGTRGAITISTNMAGRGTDIVLGDGVAAHDGLYVIGSNRHESERVDNQLRGRAGRQGDPGSSRFFISLEDDLIQRYGVMALIPADHRPSRQDAPISDPIVAREIARAQRIVEGQNFDIRRTLWKYSAVVEEQRRIVYELRQALLKDEIEPTVCAERLPELHATLAKAVGPDAVRRAEQTIAIRQLDRHWSDHLGLIEDIREGIHLQRYGGREPISEFHRQIVNAFDVMMGRVDDETVAAFERLTVAGGALDLSAAGLGASSSTWTYLVDDNPFSTLGLSLIANRNVGAAAAGGLMAVMYLPLTALATAAVFVRRWLKRRRG
jgi:preprotein translocase subunit SecA